MELHFPPFRLDVNNEQLWREQQEVPLRRKTFAILRYLAEHSGQLVTKEDLLQAVWGNTLVSEEGLRDYLREIRHALGDDAGAPQFVETVRGRGYCFLPTVSIAQPVPSSELQTSSSEPSPIPNPQTPIPSLSLPDKPSIIVLPFVNLSNDPEQEYFSDGVTEDITNFLSRLSGLFVISRTSAFTYKGKPTKVQDISREMGVRYVLEGSVRKTNHHIRVTAQLIDALTDHHLWAERYERPLIDIFTVQDEIVQKIVTTLKLQLTLREQGYRVHKHTDNVDAYDTFLRSVEYFWGLTKETIAKARELLEKALSLDPQYAQAYAQLGWTYYFEWVWHWSTDPQTLERALVLAQQALALDDSLPAVHSLLSVVHAQKQQYDQAITEDDRAIALNPNNADSYVVRAEALSCVGRPEEALFAAEQAIRLNPRCPPPYLFELGCAYRLTGRYADAVAVLKEAIRRSPKHPTLYVHLSASQLEQWAFQQSADMQMLAGALAAAQQAITLNDASPRGHVALGSVYLWQKQYQQAFAELERAIAVHPNHASSHAALAEVMSRTGGLEEAVEMAEQALRLRSIWADWQLCSVGIAYDLAGQPEDAIAPLKQYLTHYPNILGAHLTLAAVYSELGKDIEAQAEAAEVLRLNPHFSLEVHKEQTPIKDPTMLERHIVALSKAGLK
jgi:adenylate cyclase